MFDDDFDDIELDAAIDGEMDAKLDLPYGGDAPDDLTDEQKAAYEDGYLAGYDHADDGEC